MTLDSDSFNFEVPNCDFTVPLIVDGEKAKPDEFPHMAALGWRRDVTSGECAARGEIPVASSRLTTPPIPRFQLRRRFN